MKQFVFYCIMLNAGVLFGAPLIEDNDWSEALPFQRTLRFQTPLMSGKDIAILQNLLRRYKRIAWFKATGYFDSETEHALIKFQEAEGFGPPNGILNPITAKKVIDLLMPDNYKDDGIIPDNYKFKLHVPVHRDRTIEINATLYGNDGKVLHVFKVRTRGGTGNIGQALNQLTTNGDTPTGLSTLDLNSKEPFVKSYGPYPVLRVVKGIKGNTAIGRDDYIGIDGKDTFLSDYRIGILVHTGEWPDWDKSKPMPNSNGCMHVHPDDMEKIDAVLIEKAGAIINEKPLW